MSIMKERNFVPLFGLQILILDFKDIIPLQMIMHIIV